jgi:hypothetical protein
MHDKQPLYRKVNTTAHGVRHDKGGDFRDERRRSQRSDSSRESMHGRKQRGLDYTPLFKFLLSKCGQPWNAVHAEATARLDRQEPIFWLVALPGHERNSYVRLGESSYYSGMYVDDAGILQLVDPSLGPSSLTPTCKCCMHTFNGVPFTRPLSNAATPPRPDSDVT